MYPAEVLGNIAGFIALYGANEVPTDGVVLEFRLFGQGLLQIIFADMLDARAQCKLDFLSAAGFANGHQDGLRCAGAEKMMSCRDPRLNRCYITYYGIGCCHWEIMPDLCLSVAFEDLGRQNKNIVLYATAVAL